MASNVEVVATHIIRPSSPTPHHQNCFKLSVLDQLNPSIYISQVLFYPVSIGDGAQPAKPTSISAQLKASLSEILTSFFPFAGRINANVSIDCNDAGVPYFEAEVGCSLSDILIKPEPHTMRHFLPINSVSEDSVAIPLLVQVSFFKCGGMAIGVCISHKIADVATLHTFIHSWAITASGHMKADIPDFTIASLFPPADFLSSMTLNMKETDPVVTKRFVFDASSITALQAKVNSAGSACFPTRVQVVSALIWKCAMIAGRLISSSKTRRSSILSNSVNMRNRLIPPLPESSIGNFVGQFFVEKDYDSEIELHGLVEQLKNGLTKLCDSFIKEMQGSNKLSAILQAAEESGSVLKRDDIDFYFYSSWCGFSFYDADFGWGKPIWVGIQISPYKNVVVLMDTSEGDGIEAWVYLKEEHMVVFEQDPELLAVANPNPSILNF